jgi:hypothetical protein
MAPGQSITWRLRSNRHLTRNPKKDYAQSSQERGLEMRAILFAFIGCTGLLLAGQALSQTPPPATGPATSAPAATTPVAVVPATTTPAAATTPAPVTPATVKPGATTASAPASDANKPAPADIPQKPLIPPNWPFTYGVISLVLAVALFALALITWFIWTSNFKLSEALSEETDDGVLFLVDANNVAVKDAAGNPVVVKDAAGNPVKKTRLVGSVSRVIALLGSVVLIVIYIGFGIFTLYFYASGQGVPTSTKDFLYVLAGGMSLFAPYVVNKFASVFDVFKKP